MGEGDFIMPLDAGLRKSIRKMKGDKVKVWLEVDNATIRPPADLMECLADEPRALEFFRTMANHTRTISGTGSAARKQMLPALKGSPGPSTP